MAKPKRRDPALEQAFLEAGGPVAVARFITENFEPISPQAVCKWLKCPPRRATQVAAAVKAARPRGKTTARKLCPELYVAVAA